MHCFKKKDTFIWYGTTVPAQSNMALTGLPSILIVSFLSGSMTLFGGQSAWTVICMKNTPVWGDCRQSLLVLCNIMLFPGQIIKHLLSHWVKPDLWYSCASQLHFSWKRFGDLYWPQPEVTWWWENGSPVFPADVTLLRYLHISHECWVLGFGFMALFVWVHWFYLLEFE